jgi:hypothetical protein
MITQARIQNKTVRPPVAWVDTHIGFLAQDIIPQRVVTVIVHFRPDRQGPGTEGDASYM